jgi:hypothetical protein
MVSWLYFEGADAFEKWVKEVISHHERWGHTDTAREYKKALKTVKRFNEYIYSRKCFGYILVICDHVDVIALCKNGEVIEPVDIEEWLEYADL